jgi:alanine racemase
VDATLFAWLFAAEEDFAALVAADVDLGISRVDQLERIAAVASGDHPGRVHLKIDTGLHRNGATEAEWPGLVRRTVELAAADRVRLEGVWTHIGEASVAEDSLAIARFDAALRVAASLGAHPPLRHLAASAAGFERDDARFDAVRVGAFTYGIAPGGGRGPDEFGLTSVMTLTAAVTAVSGVRRGDLTATVDAGYLDGIPVEAPGRVTAAVRGTRHQITAVRAASLDLTVDATISVGDTVTFFGTGDAGEPTLQEWADALRTIGEEIVVRIPASVPRRYVG